MSDLINVPITPQRLPYNVVVLVLDLSRVLPCFIITTPPHLVHHDSIYDFLQPDTVIDTAIQWLTLIKARVQECSDKIKKATPASFTSLVEKAADVVKHMDHPDRCAAVV